MPTLHKRSDGCYIVKGKIHNEDEDFCTWQVDDGSKTLSVLEKQGINVNDLPATFTFSTLLKLIKLEYVSTEETKGEIKRKNAEEWAKLKNNKNVLIRDLAKSLKTQPKSIIKEGKLLGFAISEHTKSISVVWAETIKFFFNEKQTSEVISKKSHKATITNKQNTNKKTNFISSSDKKWTKCDICNSTVRISESHLCIKDK